MTARFTLPQLNNPATDVSLARTRGKYTVVNFWASTCSACLREMPDLQTAHRTLGDSARFVGMESEIGTLEVGKRADIILQSGNPTENIYGLLTNKLTMKDGRIVIDKR